MLTTTVLYLNLAVRHQVYHGKNLTISDSIVLYVAMLGLGLIVSGSIRIFDTKSPEDTADDSGSILKCMEVALSGIPDAVLVLEMDASKQDGQVDK